MLRPALSALLAGVLFGLSTPFAKLLVGHVEPLLLAAVLYLGSGLGLYVWRARLQLRRSDRGDGRAKGMPRLRLGAGGPIHPEARINRRDMPWLIGAIGFGGVLGPVLLMKGLVSTPASTASLLLNLEGVFTALLAVAMFGEHFGRRVALGLGFIVAGGLVLSWSADQPLKVPLGSLAVIGACLVWALDNNLTRRIAGADAVQIAALKGLVAGSVNLALAFSLGATLPSLPVVLAGLVVGAFGYGASLVLFVLALRGLGAARTAGYFAVAPFIGAAASVLLLHEPISPLLGLSSALMAIGVWLHLSEHHQHSHTHDALVHEHSHRHDDGHHAHEHDFPWDGREPHSHVHAHEPTVHAHPHYPDAHHRHRH